MDKIKLVGVLIHVFSLFWVKNTYAQPVPALEENIPFLVTFSKQAETKWGDDDFCQVFFFQIPQDFKDPVYFRVFDPDCGGQHDEMNVAFNSLTKFSVYGGVGCISTDDARNTNPIGNFKSGNLLATKTFGQDVKYDNNWYTFGPFNPSEGELSKKYGGYVFKLICEGIKGDDGNLYRYHMTTKPNANISVEGGNAFTFEYTFRLHSDPWQTSHVYPYVDDKVISLMQSNFDWDNDGFIRLFSIASLGAALKTSGDDNWTQSVYRVSAEEKGKSMDIQFTKNDRNLVNNNNVVFYLTNQYGELLPFYTVPLGGLHTPQGKMKITEQKKK